VQVHHKDWRDEQAIDLYIDNVSETKAGIEALSGVKSVSVRVYSGALVAPGEETGEPADAEPGMVLGVDVNIENREGGILESLPPELLPGDGRVVVGRALAKRLGIEAGTKIAVIGQDADEAPAADLFEVSAVIGGATEVVNKSGVVMSMADAGEFLAMRDQAHEIVVRGDDHEKAGELAAAIKALPLLEGAEVLPWREASPMLVTIVDMKDWIDYVFLVIVFAAAAAGIANTMVMSTYERTPEFGMLLAVGSRPGRIVRMVLVEAIVLGLVGVAVGSAVGTVLVLITSHTGIDYAALTGISTGETDMGYMGLNFSLVMYPKLEFRHIGLGVVAVILTAVVTSVWPAASAARLEPVEAMRS
jgi:ABC-type lipoprotein release transport system permease subunit